MWNISVATLVWIYFACFTTANPHNRIVGGGVVDLGQHPHEVALSVNETHLCSGAIISHGTILTTASCVLNTSADDEFIVRFGSLNTDSGGITRGVKEVFIHPNYNKLLDMNNIAVLRLNESVKFTDNIKPIRLASSKPALGTNVVVTGWSNSFISKGDKKQPLLWSYFTVSPSIVKSKMSLYHDLLNNVCPSDSGSSVEYNGELVGVTGSGHGICGLPYFIPAANVAENREWIEETADLK